MTSVTFPSPQDHLPHSHHSNGDSQFYSAVFDTSASFTMNPLSSHPPRTPRTSIISNHNATGLGRSAYDTREEVEGEDRDAVEELEIDEEDRVKEAESRVRREDVWREIFFTSYGRDKAFVRRPISLFLSVRRDTDCAPLENYTVFYSRISIIPWTHSCEQIVETV